MPFQPEPGASLGPYRIIRLLGRGGMGDVYLAEDTRLNRKVALKLLSAQFIRDPERTLRFTQEARAASALNHPNIITIYDVGDSDGVPYIAAEFIDGQTLRQRIHSGPLPLGEALNYAIQAGGALAVAHEAGIIHRDIKPENIMIRSDGYVKVVDFGLAKLAERTPAPGNSGTVLMGPAVTTLGTVMGTAQYMSPEQARGQAVDGRSDIFSLAVVLYEMIAGHPPFSGETPSHQIVAILEKAPEPLRNSVPDAPPELESIVEKGLAKSTEERYQAAQEFVADLKEIQHRLDLEAGLQHSAAGGRFASGATPVPSQRISAAMSAATVPAPERKRPAARRAWLAIAVAALAAVAVWFGIARLRRTVPFQNYTVQELTDTGKVRSAVISPDGRYVVYMQAERGATSLYIRQVLTGTAVAIEPPTKEVYVGLTFSADGDYLYFVRAQPGTATAALYRISSLGGEPARIKDAVYSAVSFSPDNRQMAYIGVDFAKSEKQVTVAHLDGSDAHILRSAKAPEVFTTDPVWSPDGKFIAIGVARPSATGYHGQPLLIATGGGNERSLGPPERWTAVVNIAWTPDSSGVYMVGQTTGINTATQIWLVPLSGAEPRQITKEVSTIYTGLSLTADGKAMLSVRHVIISGLFLMEAADPASAHEIGSQGPNLTGVLGLGWTPDARIVYTGRADRSVELWLRDADENSNPKRLTNDNAVIVGPELPTGAKRVWFSSNRGTGAFHVWSMDLAGGDFRQVTSGKGEVLFSVSRDGKAAFYGVEGEPGFWRVSPDGGTPVRVTEKRLGGPVLSPDGQWLAYTFLDEAAGRRTRFAIMPASGGEPAKIFDYAVPSSASLEWTPDGSGLSYAVSLAGAGQIWVQPVAGGAPKQITAFRNNAIFSFGWSPDGKQIVLSRGNTNSDAVLMRQKN